jgi:hypothetical protein
MVLKLLIGIAIGLVIRAAYDNRKQQRRERDKRLRSKCYNYEL